MAEPQLIPRDALQGAVVGVSVSDSADLARLGLSPTHCELAVAELARAILLAGGTVVYGGRLVPAGFTDILLAEVRSYRQDREALVLCVPETEHRRLSTSELLRRQQELQSNAELVCLDSNGEPIDIRTRPRAPRNLNPTTALTAMRRHITARCDARVILGGRLTGYQGALPGLLEEASMSLHAGQPLYVAGGFGGAAAALAAAFSRADLPGSDVAPEAYPEGAEHHADLLIEITATERATDGLDVQQRAQLAWSHRPGEIASLVVYGLSRSKQSY
jgi:hypothetical protein